MAVTEVRLGIVRTTGSMKLLLTEAKPKGIVRTEQIQRIVRTTGIPRDSKNSVQERKVRAREESKSKNGRAKKGRK